MSLGDAIATALPRLRAQAESLMRDTIRADRQTGTTPDGLGGDVPVLTTLYTGRGKVQSQAVQQLNPEAGGHVYTVQRYEVHLPVGSFSPAVGDLLSVTTAADNPELTGRVFRVTALMHKSQPTAYRLAVEEVVA